MKFQNFQVSPADSSLKVSISTFDEADLSNHSNCQEALQKGEPSLAHGFIDTFAMLDEVCRRLVQSALSHALSQKRVSIAQADAGYEIPLHH